MARTRQPHPDGYVIDVDRGTGTGLTGKRAALIDPAEYGERGFTREGARDLDAAVEQLPGLTRAQRDRERAMPRDVTASPGHPAMVRTLPEPDAVRRPLSSRQRKARAVAKRSAQDNMPGTQYQALATLITDPAARNRINDALSDAAGDAQQLDDTDRTQVQRLDRAIGQYEQGNDRGHVVYSNLQMPAAVGGDTLRLLRQSFPPGTVVSFDRYTGGAHTMHEISPAAGGDVSPVLEMQTRRGIYLGRSDSLDDTTHLLPRGISFRAVSVHLADYERPDGTRGRCPVIQLRDIDSI